ncbi:MAG: hypothetical protein ACLFR0_03280 [Alphaproteobacteria bacterium]
MSDIIRTHNNNSRQDRMEQIVDYAHEHIEKVAFTKGVMGLSAVFALGAPKIFEEIVEDLMQEVNESAEVGKAMMESLDATPH